MQKPHLPVRDGKPPRLMEASIGPRMEICRNVGLPLTMVPYFNQSNVYVKKKLQELRFQKCIPLVGAKIALTSVGLQTSQSHVSQYRAENENLRKSGSTFHHGTVFAPKQCLYPKEATVMESPKMHSSNRCKNRTYLCVPANYPVSCKPV